MVSRCVEQQQPSDGAGRPAAMLEAYLALTPKNETTVARRLARSHDVTNLSEVSAMNHVSDRHPLPGVPSYVTSSVHDKVS